MNNIPVIPKVMRFFCILLEYCPTCIVIVFELVLHNLQGNCEVEVIKEGIVSMSFDIVLVYFEVWCMIMV